MNKRNLNLLALLIILPILSCNQTKPPDATKGTAYTFKSDSLIQLNDKINSRIGSWVEKGVECYGIVIVNFPDGRTIGKSVKCKVISIKPDRIKMKTIESVSLMESEGCNKLGLAYGDTWWETEGDLYKTKEEADNYLREKGWYIQ
jgi:hypothetical protein